MENKITFDFSTMTSTMVKIRRHSNVLMPAVPIPRITETEHLKKTQGQEVKVFMKKSGDNLVMVVVFPQKEE